jgi:hypothetical protein
MWTLIEVFQSWLFHVKVGEFVYVEPDLPVGVHVAEQYRSAARASHDDARS